MLRCIICQKDLTGKQTKFCSTRCRNQAHQSYEQQQVRGHKRKSRLIQLFGGKCSLCGYSKNYGALCFHHTRDKVFQLDIRNCSNRRWQALLEEATKCELVCSNCHNEIHYPHLNT